MATGFGAGYKVLCGLGKESTWGTRVAPTELTSYLNDSLNQTEDWQQNEVIKGKAGYKSPEVVGIKAGGNLSVRANYQETDLLMALLFGGAAAAPTGTGPWTHTISLAEDPTRSLSVHIEKDVNVHGVAGLVLNTGTLVIEPGPIRWDFDCAAKQIYRDTTHRATLTGLTDPKKGNLHFNQCTVRLGDLANALGSDSDDVEFSSLSITIANNFAIDHRGATSGDYILQPRRSGRRGEITLAFTLPRFKDSIFTDWEQAETPLQCDITFTDGTNIFLLEFPTLKIKSSAASAGGPEIIPHSFTLQAVKNESNSYITETKECVLTITNDRSAAIWA